MRLNPASNHRRYRALLRVAGMIQVIQKGSEPRGIGHQDVDEEKRR